MFLQSNAVSLSILLSILCFSDYSRAKPSKPSVLKQQKRYSRVRQAHKNKNQILKAKFARAGIPFPPKAIFLRAFKHEKQLELWVQDSNRKMKRLESYPICGVSGVLGPKRQEGDGQIPEGVYYIDRLNPVSQFHLSLGLNYPNRSDRKFGHPKTPGSDIFIHGDCVSIGCLAMTDELIEEIYLSVIYARNSGQKKVPVHIYPFRFQRGANAVTELENRAEQHGVESWFWKNLYAVFVSFEENRKLPKTKIVRGRYRPQ